jgi:DNA-binding MarR family transcriptional regulator
MKPSPRPASRRQLVRQVGLAVRTLGAQSVVTSQIIAARFGLHTTDLEVLDHVFLRADATAGELSRSTGLSPGSMTALLDRLVSAGYIERHADPADRRRVRVRVRVRAIAPIRAVYAPIQQKMFRLWSTYDTPQLRVIVDFLLRSTELAVVCAAEIQRAARARPAARPPQRRRGIRPLPQSAVPRPKDTGKRDHPERTRS